MRWPVRNMGGVESSTDSTLGVMIFEGRPSFFLTLCLLMHLLYVDHTFEPYLLSEFELEHLRLCI
jgi:hypothetical protein